MKERERSTWAGVGGGEDEGWDEDSIGIDVEISTSIKVYWWYKLLCNV